MCACLTCTVPHAYHGHTDVAVNKGGPNVLRQLGYSGHADETTKFFDLNIIVISAFCYIMQMTQYSYTFSG